MSVARHLSIAAWVLGGLLAAGVMACETNPAQNLTVEHIVAKNVAARGGLKAWRNVQTMVWRGHIETGKPAVPIKQFVYEWKQPNKTRFEVTLGDEKTMQVFNGANGWQVRASNNGGLALHRYSRSQLRSARDAQGIEGLLIDHEARGIAVALDGIDDVEGHSAYRLNVTLPSGAKRKVWVDAHTFLELKYERERYPTRGRSGGATVYYRSYQTVGGLQVPRTIETQSAGAAAAPEKMVVEDVALNLSLSDAHFGKPDVSRRDRERVISASR